MGHYRLAETYDVGDQCRPFPFYVASSGVSENGVGCICGGVASGAAEVKEIVLDLTSVSVVPGEEATLWMFHDHPYLPYRPYLLLFLCLSLSKGKVRLSDTATSRLPPGLGSCEFSAGHV